MTGLQCGEQGKPAIDGMRICGLLARHLPDAGDRRAVAWDTPRRLFGFGEAD